MTNYIIIGPPRSGNTYVHLALAGHPQISAFIDEVKVHPFYTSGISIFTKGGETETEKARSHLELFKSLTSLSGKTNTISAGIHSVVDQPAEAEDIASAIQQNYPDVKIILVRRLDLLARLASMQQAKASGMWTAWQPVDLQATHTLDDDTLADFIHNSMETMSILEKLNESHEVLQCIYEKDIAQDSAIFLNKAFRFLGVDEMDISWHLPQKIAPPPHVFINDYHERCSYLLRQLYMSDEMGEYQRMVIGHMRQTIPVEHRTLQI